MTKEEFDRLRWATRTRASVARDRVVSAAKHAVEWATENPELAISAIGAATFFTRKAGKVVAAVADERHRNSTIYDRSLGMYWELRHPLTSQERLAIERRRGAGESYGQILSDMRLLRR